MKYQYTTTLLVHTTITVPPTTQTSGSANLNNLNDTTTHYHTRQQPQPTWTIWKMSRIIPSLTILSEDQKFNGNNLLQWNTHITQLLGAKGLLRYINGKIPKPAQHPTSDTTDTTATATGTPIYLTTPTLDEWTFWDQATRGHITLNCTDIASLGVIMTGTAKDAYDSIHNEWRKSTDMQWSQAQEALNQTKYTEGTDIQDHIKLLCSQKAAVDNLSSSAMSDETWRGIIIWSIPPTVNWLPVIPSLYSMTTSADITSTLFTHGMILARGANNIVVSTGANPSSTALAIWTTKGCTNLNCKASNRSTHHRQFLLARRQKGRTVPTKLWPQV